MAPVGDDLQDVAAQEDAAPVGSGRPVQHAAAIEVTATADQHHSPFEHQGLAVPENNRRRRPHDPLPIGGMEVDRHITERVTPLHDRRVIMRMGDGNPGDAAQVAHRLDRGLIEEADAVPKEIARRRLNEQGALADGEFRPCHEAGEGWFLGLEDIAVLGLHLGQSSPALPFPADVLTFVFTDRAAPRRHFTGRVLDTAGRAEKRRRGRSMEKATVTPNFGLKTARDQGLRRAGTRPAAGSTGGARYPIDAASGRSPSPP